jgi:uncharacterized Rmd1/YagE family protein
MKKGRKKERKKKKETKKQRNKERKKERNKERNKETKKQRNKERKKEEHVKQTTSIENLLFICVRCLVTLSRCYELATGEFRGYCGSHTLHLVFSFSNFLQKLHFIFVPLLRYIAIFKSSDFILRLDETLQVLA